MYGKKPQRFSGSEAVTYNQKQETSLILSEFVWTPGIFSIKSFHTYYAKIIEVGFKKKMKCQYIFILNRIVMYSLVLKFI